MKFLFVVFFLFTIPSFAQNENIFNKESSVQYAQYLINSKQFDLAKQELERLSFLYPNDLDLKYELAKIELYNKNYEAAERFISSLFNDLSIVPQNFAQLLGKILLLAKETDKLDTLLVKNIYLTQSEKMEFRIGKALQKKNLVLANQLLDSYGQENKNSVKSLIEEGQEIKHKSPALALALSAMVPGLGKVYTNRWKDGILSFITVGLLGYQSYVGFSEKGLNSAFGWVNGTLALGFYAGNLYGSYISAKKYNLKQEKTYQKDLEAYINNNF